MNNRPRGRQKNITGHGKGINRRGYGLGTGPVGKPGRTPNHSGGSTGGNATRSGGGFSGGKLILILLVLLLGGGGGSGTLLDGGGSDYTYETSPTYAYEAISKYGAIKGAYLALRRLLRCHPFYKGDPYDPVP